MSDGDDAARGRHEQRQVVRAATCGLDEPHRRRDQEAGSAAPPGQGSMSWRSPALRLPPPKRTGLGCGPASPARSTAGAMPAATGMHCASPIRRHTPAGACPTHSSAGPVRPPKPAKNYDPHWLRPTRSARRPWPGRSASWAPGPGSISNPRPATDPLARASQPRPGHRPLSARERQVLELLAEGLTNRRIAETLFITEKTVSAHVTHILEKLQVTNRSQAGAIARSHGKAPAEGEVTRPPTPAERGKIS